MFNMKETYAFVYIAENKVLHKCEKRLIAISNKLLYTLND